MCFSVETFRQIAYRKPKIKSAAQEQEINGNT